MLVELDIFSGRPNPVWSLTDAESEQFKHMLSTLSECDPKAAFEKGLGYRGLIVTPSQDCASWFHRVSLYNSVVVVFYDNNSEQCLIDEDRKLECWLLQKGKGTLSADLYRHVMDEIQC